MGRGRGWERKPDSVTQGNDKDLGGKPLLDLKQDYFLLRWGNTSLPKSVKDQLVKTKFLRGDRAKEI